ncbi:MAG: hypothetical protein AYP45_12750 [Candidatus Brocadia carolinensis]|uniref:Uncharacterized protein n=1 Tax=Candidatus Brocadia carolinensis TaxID=1004156 RepID=A0A1V4ARP7_9BACT|nr:MAG: hypothetical protein AYP45_12750 [Candidatus Brocadia caroliniensis]
MLRPPPRTIDIAIMGNFQKTELLPKMKTGTLPVLARCFLYSARKRKTGGNGNQEGSIPDFLLPFMGTG